MKQNSVVQDAYANLNNYLIKAKSEWTARELNEYLNIIDKSNEKCLDKKIEESIIFNASLQDCPAAIYSLSIKKANVNFSVGKSEFTPLHFAAANNFKETAAALIKSGADFFAKDSRGRTPLNLAVENNSTEAVSCLIKLIGSSINTTPIVPKTSRRVSFALGQNINKRRGINIT